MRIALVGTRGVPARYGGFETCIEEVGRRLVKMGHEVRVYTRVGVGEDRPPERYLGMDVDVLPAARRRSLETLSHTALSVADLVRRPTDVAVVFNSANSPLLPVLMARGIPFATHVDGLEWQRSKWGPVGRRYYRFAESLAVRWSDALIADAKGIADYYRLEFGAPTVLLRYGAPLVDADRPDLLEPLGLRPRAFHLVVARFEPENHVREAVEAHRRSGARQPLVVVGAAPYAEAYTVSVRAAADRHTRFLGAVWDQDVLDQLYANCSTYVHGHSVGGTNPSLLRAMGAGAAVNAYDVVFNREVLGAAGAFWDGPAALSDLFEDAEARPDATARRGVAARVEAGRFDWDEVAAGYAELCAGLRGGRFGGPRPSGRRHVGAVAEEAIGA